MSITFTTATSGLSDMKIFVFNRFCNTFFKKVFSGR